MRPLTILATSALILAALPVQAETTRGCFERHYTEAHLAAHPEQVVASIWLKLEDSHGEFLAGMGVVTADQGHAARDGKGDTYFSQGLYCYPDSDPVVCSVECDGGAFWIERDDGEVMEIRTEYLLVGDNESEDCGGAIDIAERPMTSVTYRLYRADDAACETN